MSPTPPSRRLQRMAALNRYLSEDFLGGPRAIKFATVVNLQKGGTLPFVAGLMCYFHNTSAEAWTYLALHGSYGLIWLLKDYAFPDPAWEKRVTIGGAMLTWLFVLGPYWVAPYLLISGVLGPRPPAPSWLLGLATGLYSFGVVLMMSADAQKFFTLRHTKQLIDDGLFKHVRHPNYLGEMLVYGSFALIVRHVVPWLILGLVWTQLFLVNILMKEASLSRYPGWRAYKARTGLLWPRLWPRRPSEPDAATPDHPGG